MQNLSESQTDEILQTIEEALKDRELIGRGAGPTIEICQKKYGDFQKLFTERLKQKNIIFVRHAQSGYNEWKKSSILNMVTSYKNTIDNYDPSITNTGKEQCKALVTELNSQKLNSADLILISPLRRAIQTYMEIKESNILSGCSNIILTPLIRERLDTAADIGTPLSLLKQEYSSFDFQFLTAENWWSTNLEYKVENRLEVKIHEETRAKVRERIALLLIWLAFRKEKSIVLVAHSNFYDNLTEKLRLIKPNIKNAEMKELDSESLVKFMRKYFN